MGLHSLKEELTVLAMVGERFGLQQFDSLPSGVSLPLRHALDKCRDSSPNDWPVAAYVLLGRKDLAMSTLARKCKYKEIETPTNVNVISLSTPYMLNLYPVTISSTISDAIGLEGAKLEDTDSVDGRLLCSSRPVAIQTTVNHRIVWTGNWTCKTIRRYFVVHMEKQATLARLSVVNRSLKVARKFTAVKSQ
ncbi:hypothetical protein KIW84_014128 [Lathyrus oleraceus]|uniref:Anaphase-promoting complex subunit 1 middle domain-containing protein n=1 Tax=Pisum sativum TaxID=3888 RepID=A0A9D5BMC1_PEA|nr:hypothetical protein KIW84_014128 [Pisum sativum]